MAKSTLRTPANNNSMASELESALADERTEAAVEAEEAAIEAIKANDAAGVSAILDGASPDDAARLRRYLGLPKSPGKPRRTSNALADDWR